MSACAHREATPLPLDRPYVLVLGTAQDGGLPQIAGRAAPDVAARRDRTRRRLVASLLIVDPRSGRRWLVDATPDIREQVEWAEGHPPGAAAGTGRPPLFDGIFLTHGHMGHVAGLLQLGREAYGARGQVVHATESLSALIETQAPWELLVRLGHVRMERLAPGEPVVLAPDLVLTPVAVPHRAEYTDTVGFLVRGPHRTLLYLPDIDAWESWNRVLEDVLHTVDVALLDGTFFSGDELPGRSMAEVPHPRIRTTLARLAALPPEIRARVWFTHLNHTNPATDPASSASATIRTAGSGVAAELQVFEL